MIDIAAISTGLTLGDDGIWYGSEDQCVSFPVDGHENHLAVEEKSFWFKHRNACFVSIIKQYPPENNGAIFDIGGGNGTVSSALTAAGFETVVVEPGRTGACNAKRRGLRHVICATTETAGFQPGSLPAAGLFDVLEHVKDDAAFLESIRHLMIQGGRLYLTVPAYSWLWAAKDVLAGHFRRYTLADICAVVRAAGFEIEFSSYLFRFLPVPIFLLRTIPYRLGLSRPDQKGGRVFKDHAAGGGMAEAGFSRLMDILSKPELANLDQKKPMCFGSSCLVVARVSKT